MASCILFIPHRIAQALTFFRLTYWDFVWLSEITGIYFTSIRYEIVYDVIVLDN